MCRVSRNQILQAFKLILPVTFIYVDYLLSIFSECVFILCICPRNLKLMFCIKFEYPRLKNSSLKIPLPLLLEYIAVPCCWSFEKSRGKYALNLIMKARLSAKLLI